MPLGAILRPPRRYPYPDLTKRLEKLQRHWSLLWLNPREIDCQAGYHAKEALMKQREPQLAERNALLLRRRSWRLEVLPPECGLGQIGLRRN